MNCPVDESGCAAGEQPSATTLSGSGNVTNRGTQPSLHSGQFPALHRIGVHHSSVQLNVHTRRSKPLENIYVGNMSSRRSSPTRSPWGTLDQGGNVVEITDTIAPPPPLGDTKIVWRRWHGGVVTATAYQMWLSAVGVTPQTVPGYAINPGAGFVSRHAG